MMERIKAIAASLGELDAMLLTGEFNRQYATGFKASDGAVLVARDKAYFFTDGRYFEAAEAAVAEAEVMLVKTGDKYPKLIKDAAARLGAKRIGFEERDMSYDDSSSYAAELPDMLVPAQKILDALRAAKTDEELEIMRQAQKIADKSFMELLPVINMRMTEKDIAAELVYRMMKNGGEDKSFDTIVVSGKRTSLPHGEPTDALIQPGFLTIDFGVRYKGYCSDTTRTLCVGEPTEEMRRVYDTVLRAQLAGIAAAKAGVMGRDIDAAARKVIEEAGWGEYFNHSFGHSLGIEIHESPTASPLCDTVMPVGAVVSAEPGIYMPGKFGVRIEDVVFMREDGCEDITGLPKELTVICD